MSETQKKSAAQTRRVLGTAVLMVCALTLPFVLSGYQTFQATQIVIFAVALLGLVLLTGFSGQISLGHGAFFAIGAYTAVICISRFGLPYWMAIPVSGAVCLGVGVLFGIPALRLGGLYLALMTYAFGIIVPQLLRHKSLAKWTGGVEGISLEKPEAPFGLPLTSDQWLFLFCSAVALVMFGIARNLLEGRVGRAWIAIRDQPIAATSMGINLAHYKTAAFGISAMYAGVAGGMSAVVMAYVAPDSFSSFLSISLLVGVVVGGTTSIGGALLGAAFIQLVPNLAEQISKAAPAAVYGAMLLVIVLVVPGGLAQLFTRIWGAARSHLGGKRAALSPVDMPRVVRSLD